MSRASSFTLAGALAVVLGMTPCAAGENPGRVEVLLEAAARREVVDGDLKAAVSMYEKVVAQAGDNRLVAAKARVGIGRCYEHLGERAKARRAYQRVAREFADQKPEAAEARRRLKALGGGAEPTHDGRGLKPDSGDWASNR